MIKPTFCAIAAGYRHSLLLTARGELFGCGVNEYGQLGLGHNKDQASWVLLRLIKPIFAPLQRVALIVYMLTAKGELFGCGRNQYGQLGLGHTEDQASWVLLSDKTDMEPVQLPPALS